MRRAFVALVPTAVHGRRNGAEAKEVRWAAGAAAAGLWRGSDASPGKSKRKNERRGGCFMPNTSNWYSVYKKLLGEVFHLPLVFR